MKVSEYKQMMSYLTRPGSTEERTNFVLGGAAIKGMRETVAALTKNLDRLPTQDEIVKATGKAAKTIKSYFKEGVD